MKRFIKSSHFTPFIYLIGPLLILGIALGINELKTTPFYLPNPLAILVLVVITVSSLGGYKQGILTAIPACLYFAYSLSIPGTIMEFTDNDLRRVIAWSICLPAAALVVGFLKTRSEMHLQEQLAEKILHEEDLKASEERTRAIINSAYDAFIAIDIESRIQEWNPQAEKTFGWTRNEALGRKLTELIIPKAFHQGHMQGLKHFSATGEGKIINRRIEVPAQNRQGQQLSMEMTVYPIKQKDSVLFGAFLHDISSRKRADQLAVIQLEVSRVMTETRSLDTAFPELLQAICVGIKWPMAEMWLQDKARNSLACVATWAERADHRQALAENEKVELPLSYGITGKPLSDSTCSWISDVSQKNLPRAGFFKKFDIKTLLSCTIRDGENVIGALALYHTDNLTSDARILEVLSDLTKRMGMFILRRQAELELRNLSHELEMKVQQRTEELASMNRQLQQDAIEKEILYEQAQTANRLKDEFLATISHELRTPMNVILGHSELLHEEDLTPQEQKKSIDAIYRNTKAQVHIVSDILDVSRFITGKAQMNFEVVNMAEIISLSIEAIISAARAKDIELVESISTHIGLINGDPTRLQQVLWNLLSNAVKFTPRHGKIYISLTAAESNIVVTIKDTGKGIDPAFVPYVFERFRQEDSSTTRKFGGLGLGLAITKNIVESHGGNIQVTSEGKGHGATFSVILPMTAIRSHADENLHEPLTETLARDPLKGLHILVVDDQKDAQSLIATVLKRAGAQVSKASSATEAFKLLIRVRPDVLISDIGMPEQDGYDLINMVRRLPPEMGGSTLAIALTAYAAEDDHQRAIGGGFQEHLSKPIEGKKLVRAVAKLTDRYHATH